MNQQDFIYWLQGFVELGDGKPPTELQWNMIKEHLALCFIKATSVKPIEIKPKVETPYCAQIPYETAFGQFDLFNGAMESPPAPGPQITC